MQKLRIRNPRIVTAMYFAAVLILSFLPQNIKGVIHARGPMHFYGHFFVFGLLTYLAMNCGQTLMSSSFFGVLTLACEASIEVTQHLSSLNPMEWSDLIVDIIASSIATILFFKMRRNTTSTPSATPHCENHTCQGQAN